MKKYIFVLIVAQLLICNSVLASKISGNIIDTSGNIIKYVSVKNLRTNNSTKANKLGRFTLEKTNIGDTIYFSHKDYLNSKIIITSTAKLQVILIKKPKDGAKATKLDDIEETYSSKSASTMGMATEGMSYAKAPIKKNNLYENHTNNITPSAGKLTAGEINDFAKWELWADLTNEEFKNYTKVWNIAPKSRFTVIVQNQNQLPIYGSKVYLLSNNTIIWKSITDNTGKAELWLNPFINNIDTNKLYIKITNDTKEQFITNPKYIEDGINYTTFNSECTNNVRSIDIALLVDATGSMGDEIDYLKTDLEEIIQSIQDTLPELIINLGISCYRDYGEEFLIRSSDLSADIKKSLKFLSNIQAKDGGDYPEAVEVGLNEVINNFNWDTNSIAKVIFLILDAPPHNNKNVIDSINNIIKIASAKGIRILPVTCSGIENGTEFLMRALALLTNGTYIFLTDHSGIGNPHIEPSTDKYTVETFNSLIKRLILQYTFLPECVKNSYDSVISDNKDIQSVSKNINTNHLLVKLYPNPSSGVINVELTRDIKYFYIADISQKLLLKFNADNPMMSIDLNELPNGVYFLVYFDLNNKPISSKFILQR
ncbi:MAG TPA: T9SS type A sorting domain-containing protein [Candidatus Kapabacteria bacterium]|nr:T9SS type A sorting domain-containing protein [Candidatus Kapabacteria bacterium]